MKINTDNPSIKNCPLFGGIDPADLHKLLHCLSAGQKLYGKSQFILSAGDTVQELGIVLSGNVHIIQEDYWGNRAIIASINPGGLFGEAFSCAQTEKLPVSVQAVRESEILLIDYRRIIAACPSACAFHTRLVNNMLQIIARKNVMLTQKMDFLTRRTIRGRLLAYLSYQSQQAGSNSFTIPFNRQELAEYLSVDRSALSNELSKMQDDGVLIFNKNKFELL